jgi:glycosyltransferase involved in cell wall biosynthesis
MKIAIFHNFLDNIGGAEVVDLILARELKADIYTTNIDREKIQKMGFEDVAPRIFSIGKIPINAPFRQEFSYWKFRNLNIEKKTRKKYDFYIIAGDWAMAGALHNKPNLWYVFSPTREIWDLYEYTRKNSVPFYLRWIFDLWVLLRRKINKMDSRKIKRVISISKNVRGRVKKYLEKDSSVIYPPTETSKFYYKRNGDFWLSVNRLITHKRVDMQIKAFQKLPNEKLVIVGSYEQSRHFRKHANYIKKIKPKNVEILSWVDEKKLIELYADCKGFITTSQDEDFGMTPIEAMASGKPVIAPNEGGYKETIINNKTGVLIKDIDEDKLVNSIKEMSKRLKSKKNRNIYKNECQKQARKFDTKKFIEKIKKKI